MSDIFIEVNSDSQSEIVNTESQSTIVQPSEESISVCIEQSVSIVQTIESDVVIVEVPRLVVSESGSPGLPTGGTTGQVLKKVSNEDYAVDWQNETGGGGGGGSGDASAGGLAYLFGVTV